MLKITSIIRIIAEIHLLKLCDLEPQGYRLSDSNYFTYAQMVQIFQNLIIYCLAIHSYIVSYINCLVICSQPSKKYMNSSQLANHLILSKQKLHSYLNYSQLLQEASCIASQLDVNLFPQSNYCNCSQIQSQVHLIFIQPHSQLQQL